MRHDEGLALVIALLAMALLIALGMALVLGTATEVMIAAHFRTAQEAFYAADAALERAIDELGSSVSWNSALQGLERSSFVDGSPSAARTLSDGAPLDLTKATNLLNCGHSGSCTSGEMDASTEDRPWGLNNPRWTLYAYGPLSRMSPPGSSSIDSNMFVVVWVADDQTDNDNDPTMDGEDPSNPGSGVIVAHAEAFGPGGAHQAVEATLARLREASGVRVIAWRRIN